MAYFKPIGTWPPSPSNHHTDIDANYEYFVDSRDSYKFVLMAKQTVDPNDLFTPNTMIVGSSRKYGTAKAGDLAVKSLSELRNEK